MALHREIYWVGRQWAVTGYGLQAVDQRKKGNFDIEASRLWEESLLESLRTEKWLNVDDFEEALAVARKRFPEPARKATQLEEIAPDTEEPNSKQSSKQPPKPLAPVFDMRIESWPARFVRQWRIRIRR